MAALFYTTAPLGTSSKDVFSAEARLGRLWPASDKERLTTRRRESTPKGGQREALPGDVPKAISGLAKNKYSAPRVHRAKNLGQQKANRAGNPAQ